MEKPWDVVVVGSCMIDLTCYAPRLPRSGETLRGTSFVNGFGGKGCNQCVAAKKLGANCLLVARVGDDFFGKNYRGKLVDYGIPTDFIKVTENVSTGTAQITVAENGENQIVIVLGANEKLSKADVEDAKEEIANCKVLLCQLEIPESTTINALQIKSRSKKGKSVLNAAPAHGKLSPLLFTLPDIFCVNETEAEAVTGVRVQGVRGAEEAIRRLVEKGCREVIVTLGGEGAVYGKANSKEFVHVPAFAVDAVDTTGAGDAFMGALAFFLSKEPAMSVKDILKKANNAAAISVQRLGTQESFPLISELPRNFC